MRVILKMVNQMEKEELFITSRICTRVNGFTANKMVMEFKLDLMALNMKAFGRMTKCTASERKLWKMAHSMKVDTLMT